MELDDLSPAFLHYGATLPEPARAEAQRRLRRFGLRPTRQRVLLAHLMFGAGPRHVAAETLFEEARAAGEMLSLATVYNALHQFAGAGMIRSLPGAGGRAWFDTSTHEHCHYFVEAEGRLFDAPDDLIAAPAAPAAPPGYRVVAVDVVIRLEREDAAT